MTGWSGGCQAGNTSPDSVSVPPVEIQRLKIHTQVTYIDDDQTVVIHCMFENNQGSQDGEPYITCMSVVGLFALPYVSATY